MVNFRSLGGIVIGTSLLGLGVSSGCATMTQAEIKFLETRELDLEYNEAYRAAMNGLLSLGFTIDHSDKESGVVSGRRHDPRTGSKIANTLLFGVIGLAATQSSDEAVTFMLTENSPKITLLRMTVVKNGKPIVDRKLMTGIWQRIEREAMLDTRPVQTIVQEGDVDSSNPPGT